MSSLYGAIQVLLEGTSAGGICWALPLYERNIGTWPYCEKARAQASALPSHPCVNTCLIQHTYTHMHACRDPLTHAFSPIILQGFPLLMHIHLKTQNTDFIQVSELTCTCLWYKALALMMWICWQMGAFFPLACLPQFSSHTRCCSAFRVHRGSCVFWHSGSNNHSSNQYLLPKAPNAGSAPRTGNEWMIVERSHFTEKRKEKNHNRSICRHQQSEGVFFFCRGAETIGPQTRLFTLPKTDGGARGFDSICAVGYCYKVRSR